MLAKRPSIARTILLLVVALPLSLGGCLKGTSVPNVASAVTAVSGSDQFANVSAAAANPLIVLVTDQDGNPFPGGTVNWKVTGGGGTVADTSTTADAHGYTSTTYTAGATPGTATVAATLPTTLWTTTFTIHVVTP
jgi:hypothetical protein